LRAPAPDRRSPKPPAPLYCGNSRWALAGVDPRGLTSLSGYGCGAASWPAAKSRSIGACLSRPRFARRYQRRRPGPRVDANARNRGDDRPAGSWPNGQTAGLHATMTISKTSRRGIGPPTVVAGDRPYLLPMPERGRNVAGAEEGRPMRGGDGDDLGRTFPVQHGDTGQRAETARVAVQLRSEKLVGRVFVFVMPLALPVLSGLDVSMRAVLSPCHQHWQKQGTRRRRKEGQAVHRGSWLTWPKKVRANECGFRVCLERRCYSPWHCY